MSDTTNPAELEIPQAAADAWFTCGCSESGIRAGYQEEALAPIVAAELRRLAQEASDRARAQYEISTRAHRARDAEHDGAFRVIDALRERADELEGGA